MRRPRVQAPPIVVVTWLDAHTTENEELSDSEIEGVHRGYPMVSAGFLVRSDAVGVTVATDWFPPRPGDKTDVSRWRGCAFVPRGMVIVERRLSGDVPTTRAAFNSKRPGSS